MNRGDGQQILERLPLARDRPLIGYGAAILLSLIGLALRLAVAGVLPPGFPYLTFFPAVIVSAFLFGLGPGILAAALCGILSWIFFIAPGNAFAITTGTAVAILFYIGVVAVDIALIHWMQRANVRLSAERQRSQRLAETRALLFAELQHRISNNLQVVAALLSLQKKGVSDIAARVALDDAARRLGVIGRIHRQLHDPEGGRLGMTPFLRQLVADALDASGRADIRHDIAVADGIELAADAAIPVALIVAEAIANALEHGFGEREGGHIAIDFARAEDGGLRLDISDDGRGPPAGFDPDEHPSLGLRIAATLARQLGGRFTLLRREDRTIARLTLPAPA